MLWRFVYLIRIKKRSNHTRLPKFAFIIFYKRNFISAHVGWSPPIQSNVTYCNHIQRATEKSKIHFRRYANANCFPIQLVLKLPSNMKNIIYKVRQYVN